MVTDGNNGSWCLAIISLYKSALLSTVYNIGEVTKHQAACCANQTSPTEFCPDLRPHCYPGVEWTHKMRRMCNSAPLIFASQAPAENEPKLVCQC